MSTDESKPKPKVDLNKIAGTDHHRTAVTFNCFILKMTDILNSFGSEMEDVLDRADRSLSAADRKLRLMEAKLSEVRLDSETEDVPKKSPVAIPASTDTAETSEAPDVPAVSKVPEAPKLPEAVPRTVKVEEAEAPSPAVPSTSQNVILIKDDPAYSKYFKMLKMGVPEAGVIQKMKSEGVDPLILKRGDEASRLENNNPDDSSDDEESVSSFSDSD